MYKKIISLLITIVTIATCFNGVIISSASNTENSETFTIEGITYRYEDLYLDGKEVTRISNLTDNTEDILYYDKASETIYLNDKPIAILSKNFSSNFNINNGINPCSDNYWNFHDRSTTNITWVQSVTAAVLAGIIAACIPGVSKWAVLSRIGVSTLGVIAGACAGGKVICDAYTHVLTDGTVQIRYDWTFKPSTGETYGPFSSYDL